MTEKQEKAVTVCLVIIATIITITAMYFGRLFLVPIAVALVLNALFRPVVRRMQRAHIWPVFGSAIIVLGLIALLVGLAVLLSLPIHDFFDHAEETFQTAGQRLERFQQPFKKMTQAVKEVEKKASSFSSGGDDTKPNRPTSGPASPDAGGKPPVEQESKPEPPRQSAPAAAPAGLAADFMTSAMTFLGSLAETLLLLFLILAGGGKFFHKFVGSLTQSDSRRVAEEIVHESEAVVLRYIAVTALINVVQGGVIALIMWWIGMPKPLLWGLFTFIFEFVPYLGAAVMIILLAVTALASLDSTASIIMAPLSYLIITNLQNNLVSPIAYGRRLKLNPAAVLIGVMFWWFVWGIPGAFIAVPILATMKIAADRIEGLKGFGEFLGE